MLRVGPIHEICSVLSGTFIAGGTTAALTGGDISTTAAVMLMVPVGAFLIMGFGKLYGGMIHVAENS